MNKKDLIEKLVETFLKSTPFSPMIFKIISAMKDKKKSLFKFGNEIAKDPVLTAKILAVANSAQFSVKQKVSDLPFAISLLGFDLVSVVILRSLKSKINHKKNTTVYSNRELWLHSLKVAHLCRIFARNDKQANSLEYYIAGLLHDIGKTAILVYINDSDLQKIEMLVKSGSDLYIAENSVLGCNHVEIGFSILKKMNLQADILKAVLSHHKKMEKNFYDISFILALSNELSKHADFVENEDLEDKLLFQFNITSDEIPSIEKIYSELKIDLEYL